MNVIPKPFGIKCPYLGWHVVKFNQPFVRKNIQLYNTLIWFGFMAYQLLQAI